MQTLYISQQGCYVSLDKETILVKQNGDLLSTIQLPLIEQILVFGSSQVTTQTVHACLKRNIPIAYLSRMGRCYGRVLPIEKRFPRVVMFQHQRAEGDRLTMAQQIVWAKLKNSRVMLLRQRRRLGHGELDRAIAALDRFADQAMASDSIEQLLGIEGAGAASYFSVFNHCLSQSGFEFERRSRRPPKDPPNALLSFGYQVLWNHLLVLIDLQGLDPYCACLHEGSARHAALASDLIEEFRAPIIDSLVFYLVNRCIVDAEEDFDHQEDACYLNNSGRKKFLTAFVQRMSEEIDMPIGPMPRWHLLNRQVKEYMRWVYAPQISYHPYLIR